MEFNSREMLSIFDDITLCTNESQNAEVKAWHDRYKFCCDKHRATGIALTKQQVEEYMQKVKEFCESRARYCGLLNAEPFEVYRDKADRRRYVNDQVKRQEDKYSKLFLSIFKDAVGTIVVNSTRLLMFQNILQRNLDAGRAKRMYASRNIKKLNNVFYYVRAEELLGQTADGRLPSTLKDAVRDSYGKVMGEFPAIAMQIKKATNKKGEKIEGLFPVYNSHGRSYAWGVCKPISYDYFPHIMPTEGYRLYYFKPDMLATRLLVCGLEGVPYTKGDLIYRQTQGIPQGIIYKGLDPQLENALLPELFNGTYVGQNGIYKDAVSEYERTVLKRIEGDTTEVLNVYAATVTAKAETIMGVYLGAFLDEVRERGYLGYCETLYVNPELLVVKVKEGMAISNIAPINYKYFKPVTTSLIDALVNKRI